VRLLNSDEIEQIDNNVKLKFYELDEIITSKRVLLDELDSIPRYLDNIYNYYFFKKSYNYFEVIELGKIITKIDSFVNYLIREKIKKDLIDECLSLNEKLHKRFDDALSCGLHKNKNVSGDELIKIIDILQQRKIKYLVHFSPKSNCESINKWGLICRPYMDNLGIKYEVTDPERYEKRLDCISLSISTYNKRIINFKLKNGTLLEEPVIFIIDSKILYQHPAQIIFCDRNAASKYVSCGETASDFEFMFAKNTAIPIEETLATMFVPRGNKNDWETTNDQAEVLVQGFVPSKFIKGPFSIKEFLEKYNG